MRRTVLATACALTAALVLPPNAVASVAACTWTPTALSLPAGAGSTRATATDHQGGYAGTGILADRRWHAVAWRNGQFIDYGNTLNGALPTDVTDENRSGTVVGTASFFGPPPTPWPGRTIAFRTAGGTMQQLPQPANPDRVRAIAINDRGDITGENYIVSGPNFGHYVLRWPADRPGEVVQLPIPTNHIPYDADEDGSILLWSPDGYKIWRNGTMIPLATIPGAYGTDAEQISAGRVVGWVSFQVSSSTYRTVGVVWDTNGTLHQLPKSAYGYTINRDGLITGKTDPATGGGTGVWRLTQFDHAFPSSESVLIERSADDGILVGNRFSTQTGNYSPFIWRCV